MERTVNSGVVREGLDDKGALVHLPLGRLEGFDGHGALDAAAVVAHRQIIGLAQHVRHGFHHARGHRAAGGRELVGAHSGGGAVSSALGLHTDTVEMTVKTLLSNLITRIFDSPTNYLRTSHVRVEP
eukprot:1178741-Prorocentrum_minimum.AAC.9